MRGVKGTTEYFDITCSICGKVFKVDAWRKNNNARTCSMSCRSKQQQIDYQRRKNENAKSS